MIDPAVRQASYDDLRAVPPHQVAEILDGELVVSPRPAARHAVPASVLGGVVGGLYHWGRGGPGGWWILDEPELHLDRDVLVPDLAGWRRTRMPEVPDVAAFTLAPEWICEVLSPTTARIDRVGKMRIYARHGVSHAWLVDALAHTLEVYRLVQGQWLQPPVVDDDDSPVRAEPFDALELDLKVLWGA